MDESLEETPKVSKKKRKRSELRDPNAPKRPCSAYIYYSNDARQKMREDKIDGNLSMAEKSKQIGKQWAALPLEQKKVSSSTVCVILLLIERSLIFHLHRRLSAANM